LVNVLWCDGHVKAVSLNYILGNQSGGYLTFLKANQ